MTFQIRKELTTSELNEVKPLVAQIAKAFREGILSRLSKRRVYDFESFLKETNYILGDYGHLIDYVIEHAKEFDDAVSLNQYPVEMYIQMEQYKSLLKEAKGIIDSGRTLQSSQRSKF